MEPRGVHAGSERGEHRTDGEGRSEGVVVSARGERSHAKGEHRMDGVSSRVAQLRLYALCGVGTENPKLTLNARAQAAVVRIPRPPRASSGRTVYKALRKLGVRTLSVAVSSYTFTQE